MIKLAIALFVLGIIAAALGLLLLPKVSATKIIIGVVSGLVVIAIVASIVIYRAAHTLPEGAQYLESKSDQGDDRD